MADLHLAKAKGGVTINMWMVWDANKCRSPESFLAEEQLLAPLFEGLARPTFYISTDRLKIEMDSFEDIVRRYGDLCKNWNAEPEYEHPVVVKCRERMNGA